MRQILISVLLLAIFGCSGTDDHQNTNTIFSPSSTPLPIEQPSQTINGTGISAILSDPELKDHIVADISGNYFTLISERSGIFISPDSIEVERMKKEYGEEDFYTASDDNLYYEFEANKFLTLKGIKTVYPKTRYLKLRTKTGQEYFFDTKAENSSNWYLLLFDPLKDRPKIISAIDITEEYSNYFTQN